MSRRHEIIAKTLTLHRAIDEVAKKDGTTPPAVDHADWASADGYPSVRCFIDVDFVEGTNPTAVLRVWLRSHDGINYYVAKCPKDDDRWATGTITITGNDVIVFDIPVETEDYLILVEDITGEPTSWDVIIRTSPR